MVAAPVEAHECCLTHMAVHASGAGADLLVEMVPRSIKNLGLVALQAKTIVFDLYFQAMGVVAVGAGDALFVHLALQE